MWAAMLGMLGGIRARRSGKAMSEDFGNEKGAGTLAAGLERTGGDYGRAWQKGFLNVDG